MKKKIAGLTVSATSWAGGFLTDHAAEMVPQDLRGMLDAASVSCCL
ncbi:MAG: hypothetical protein ACLSA6_14005 [Holdemania massiliensis]